MKEVCKIGPVKNLPQMSCLRLYISDNWKTFSVIYIHNLYQSLQQRVLACFDPREPHKVLKVCEFSFRVENEEYITLSEVTLIDVRHFYAKIFGTKLYDGETRSR